MYITRYKGKPCPYYTIWISMLTRCYSLKHKKRFPTYKGCSVCDEWLTFTNFKSWMILQDWIGNDLDKDLLVKGNKIYSPNTCMFVPKRINYILLQAGRKDSLLLGVSIHSQSGKYMAYCRDGNKVNNLGSFDSEFEAHKAYMTFKREQILNLIVSVTNVILKEALFKIAEEYNVQ